MQTRTLLPAAALSLLALASCSKTGQLTADNFTVTPNPLEAVGGQVPATIDGRFPEKYIKPKAVVKVVPVLRYEGGEAKGQGATFQGEKVMGNDQVISYKVGGNYTMRTSFAYVPAMEKSELYLTFDARKGNKRLRIPEVKVADGVLATSQLLERTLASQQASLAPDAYQRVIKQQQKANIRFLIQQANIRNSELHSTSVRDFIKTLRDIKADQERKQIDNIEVSAYASPDGGVKLNDRLAAQREKNTNKALSKQLKRDGIKADVDTKYTAQDWEGFQELVSQSNLQDKDVILRVLSMYKDPQQREEQIKNISSAFRELADEILPQLRRSRLTINYNLIGRSDDEIKQQYKDDASKLSIEELLYDATLTDSKDEQKQIYATAARLYPNDYRAYNNLAQLALDEGDIASAKSQLSRAAAAKADAPEVKANQGLIALREGKLDDAEQALSASAGAAQSAAILGNLYLAKGQYAKAAQNLKDSKTNSAALAQLLNKDYASAQATLNAISAPDATTSYLKAIVAARTGDKSAALSNLQSALQADSSLKTYAARDLEFRSFFSDAQFQNIVK